MITLDFGFGLQDITSIFTLLLFSKSNLSIFVVEKTDIFSNDEQFKKILFLIDFTEEGIDMFFNDEQFLKAMHPIESKDEEFSKDI